MKFLLNILSLSVIAIIQVSGTPLTSGKCGAPPTKIELTEGKLNKVFSPCGVANNSAPGENISCSEALPWIQKALDKYSLTKKEQIAWYLSVLQVESGNLSFNKNHFPGRPGQGTRSMMMPNNLYLFAKESGIHELLVLTTLPYNENDSIAKEALLKVLMHNQYSFLTAAWWLSNGAKYQKPECSTLSKDLIGAGSAKVEMLFTNCLGVDGKARIESYNDILSIL